MSTFTELYERACEISDPVRSAVREAQRVSCEAAELRDCALMSGAMPRDFEVICKFVRDSDGRLRITPIVR